MPELLLELFSEEIPARLQTRAADDLRRLMVEGLKARGLEVGEAKSFATPRRLALVIEDVPKKSPAVSDERKGPRVGAPEQADAGLPQGRRPEVGQRGADRQGREEGRLLRREDREAGPARARDRRRGAARDDPRLSVAQDHALQSSARERHGAALDPAAALRSCSRSTARSCRSRSPASRPATPRAAIASTATSRSRFQALPTMRRRLKQPQGDPRRRRRVPR